MFLLIGVMIACVMTATMTDEVSGVGGLNLRDIAVLENSYEDKVAINDYGTKTIPAKSYEEAIDMVRTGKAFGAMINADIAAWYQNQINNDDSSNPLRIIKILPANLYMDCYVSDQITKELKEVFKCMYKQKEEVYKASIESFKRYCKTEVLYIGTMTDFIAHNLLIQVLIALVIGLFIAGLVYEGYRFKFVFDPKKSRTESIKSWL